MKISNHFKKIIVVAGIAVSVVAAIDTVRAESLHLSVRALRFSVLP
jgi:hypothetical protein